jgi:hypothetical protein
MTDRQTLVQARDALLQGETDRAMELIDRMIAEHDPNDTTAAHAEADDSGSKGGEGEQAL